MGNSIDVGRWKECDPSWPWSLWKNTTTGAITEPQTFRHIMERRLASFCPPSEQQAKNTHTLTHTHTHGSQRDLQTGVRANSKDVRLFLSILTGVTGNNLNCFSQRSTKLCIYIPSHKNTARPPVPSARTFFSLSFSFTCVYVHSRTHVGGRLE